MALLQAGAAFAAHLCEPEALNRLLRAGLADIQTKSRAELYKSNIREIEKFCKNESNTPVACQFDSLKKALAQVDDHTLRFDFLRSSHNDPEGNFKRILDYAQWRMGVCDPPAHFHPSCSSSRWELVFSDYLARAMPDHGRKYAFFRRWEDDIEGRVPELKAHMESERPSMPQAKPDNLGYSTQMDMESLSARAVCVVNEQACKKMINTLNKDLSDRLGDDRRAFFFASLLKKLEQTPGAELGPVHIDFKSDRFWLRFNDLKESNPRLLAQWVDEASGDADAAILRMIEEKFPEITYLTGHFEPQYWYQTATFYQPGFPARLNETLAVFRARLQRRGTFMSESKTLLAFNELASKFNRRADQLAQSGSTLIKQKILEPNGNFTYQMAAVLRKVSFASQKVSMTREQQAGAIQVAVKSKYAGNPRITDEQALDLIDLWNDLDRLSVPLKNVGHMGYVRKDVPVLGSDGVGGGAFDAWAKGNALRDYAGQLAEVQADASQSAKVIFRALEEGDANATKIIQASPRLTENALRALKPALQNAVGFRGVVTNGDDLKTELPGLIQAKKPEREYFFYEFSRLLSDQRLPLVLKRGGVDQPFDAGPEIVRVFSGADKAAAESAENFLGPVEERLAQSNFLTASWRAQHPKLILLAWEDSDHKIELYVMSPRPDPQLSAAIKAAAAGAGRDASRVSVHFLKQDPP